MSVSGLFLFIVFLLGVLAVVIWPLLQAQQDTSQKHKPALSRLLQLQGEREAILTAVRDLDFDYQTDQLAEDDYLAQRETFMQRGVEILKQIDSLESEAIESAIRERREAH
jgi:hypothetical protein